MKLGNTVILINKKTLIWRSYIIDKILLFTRQVRIIDKTNFAKAALDANSKIFIMYIAIWIHEKMVIYLNKKAQIKFRAREKS